MSKVHEIVGHLTDEENDAVLYGVMLSLFRRKATELNIDTDYESLLLNIDPENNTINIHKHDNCYEEPPMLIDEIQID